MQLMERNVQTRDQGTVFDRPGRRSNVLEFGRLFFDSFWWYASDLLKQYFIVVKEEQIFEM